jgi:formylglycine-generating enzyme required for sulfatase activity
VADLTNAGSYTGAASPYGTFDQGGNVIELNETITGDIGLPADIGFRRARGGYFNDSPDILAARHTSINSPPLEWLLVGFRVASRDYPVPATGPIGLLVVAAGLLGFGIYHRGRA